MTKSINASIIGLAWPVVLERLSLSVLSAVDAALVGHFIGADGIAAVGIGALLFWIPQAGALAIDVGSSAVIARDMGAGDRSRVQSALHAALLVALAWGLLCTLVIFVFAPQFMRWMGADSEVQPLGVQFLRGGAIGLPMLTVFYAISGSLRGMGNAWMSMIILIVVNLVNALVTFLLISGVVADLGMRASGIGYGTAGLAGGVLSLLLLVSGVAPLRLNPMRILRTDSYSFARLGRIGLPVGLEEGQFMLAFLAYTRIVSSLGTDQLAAHAVALRSLEVSILPAFALGTAATALVGQSLGAHDPDRAEDIAKRVRAFALGALCTMAVLQFMLAPYIVRLFIEESDTEVIETGTQLLRVFAFALPGMSIHASLSGALRGAGDVRFVLGAFMFSAWCIRVPLAFFLAILLGLSVPYVWLAAVTENWVRAGLTTLRFRSGKWKHMKV